MTVEMLSSGQVPWWTLILCAIPLVLGILAAIVFRNDMDEEELGASVGLGAIISIVAAIIVGLVLWVNQTINDNNADIASLERVGFSQVDFTQDTFTAVQDGTWIKGKLIDIDGDAKHKQVIIIPPVDTP